MIICRDCEQAMVPAIAVLTENNLYFFKQYAKYCKVCPTESICWRPELLEDPIPLSQIEEVIDMKARQLLCLTISQKTREFLIFTRMTSRHKIILFSEYNMKRNWVDKLKVMSKSWVLKKDEIFETFLYNKGNRFIEADIIGVHFGSPSHPTAFYRGPIFENPILFCLTEKDMWFYKLNLRAWKWIKKSESKERQGESSSAPHDSEKKEEENVEVKIKFLHLEKTAKTSGGSYKGIT